VPVVNLWPHDLPIFDVSPALPSFFIDEQGAICQGALGSPRVHLPTRELAVWTDSPQKAGEYFRNSLKSTSLQLRKKAPGSQLIVALRLLPTLIQDQKTFVWVTNLAMAAVYGMEPELAMPFETATFEDLPKTISLKDPGFGKVLDLIYVRLFGERIYHFPKIGP
jgi:hypothetical protein